MNQDFSTAFTVKASPEKVFNAVNNVRGWWSENIQGPTDEPDAEFSYHYQDVHHARMNIVEFEPTRRVSWHVLDNYFKFTADQTEWKDTRIIFEISERDGETELRFTHQGLVPAYECYQVCHDAWTHYIQDSLKRLIETGTGAPTPKEPDKLSSGHNPLEAAAARCICHRLLIETPVETVFAAITTQEGLAGWWTPDTLARPEVGTVARFSFGPHYSKEMEVLELQPYSKVKWRCLAAYEEWIGTTITFHLEPHKKGSVLLFMHDGWADYTDEFASCSYAWALFLGSLKALCETGTGTPYPAIG